MGEWSMAKLIQSCVGLDGCLLRSAITVGSVLENFAPPAEGWWWLVQAALRLLASLLLGVGDHGSRQLLFSRHVVSALEAGRVTSLELPRPMGLPSSKQLERQLLAIASLRL